MIERQALWRTSDVSAFVLARSNTFNGETFLELTVADARRPPAPGA
jgi:hypothetical protein